MENFRVLVSTTSTAHSNKLGCSFTQTIKFLWSENYTQIRRWLLICSNLYWKEAIVPGINKRTFGKHWKHRNVLAEAYTLCKNDNKTRPIKFGGWNSRPPLWGDELGNKYGKLLADYCAVNSPSILSPHQPTFVSASNKGSCIIDFCSTEQNCSNLVCKARVIEDIEFFSGAPEQGYWPLLFDIDIPVKYNNPKRYVLNYKMENWEEISIQMENIMVENNDRLTTEASNESSLNI